MRTVQLRGANATLSALVDNAANGETAVIARSGQPQAVLFGLDEWNRLRRVPPFGRLLATGLDEGALRPRDASRARAPLCRSRLRGDDERPRSQGFHP